MNQQLHIHFPIFSPDTFGELKQAYAKIDEETKDKQIEHLKSVIRGFKGWKTKRKKNV